MTTKRNRNEAPGQEAPQRVAHLELAAEALLDGWTRERVIETLISRIRRDEHYLAYRKACGRRTQYDDDVTRDLRAFALAASWLSEQQKS